MSGRLAGPGDPGEGIGQEGSDFAAKSLDGAEIGGRTKGEVPARRNPLVREPRKRALRAVRSHGQATGGAVMPIIGA